MTVEPDRIDAHATDADHVDEGLALLTMQFRDKAALAAILTSWLTQIQEHEDATWALYALGIDTSTDDALDQIGAVFAFPRWSGAGDAAYRLALHGAVFALRSSGTGDDLLNATHGVLASWAFTLTESFPASVVVSPDAAGLVPATVILAVLRRVKSAGVALQVIDVPTGDTFAFADDSEIPTVDAARGFSDTAELVGGRLVGVVV